MLSTRFQHKMATVTRLKTCFFFVEKMPRPHEKAEKILSGRYNMVAKSEVKLIGYSNNSFPWLRGVGSVEIIYPTRFTHIVTSYSKNKLNL